MLNRIFAELADEVLKDIIRKNHKETPCNPFLKPIEDEMKRLKKIEAQISKRRKVLEQIHKVISNIFDPPQTDEPKPDLKSKKTETTPSAKQPATKPIEQTTSASIPKTKQKPKSKANPKFKRLPKHRATGNQRLDSLENALHDALERLSNTKLAFYVKVIKQVRIALVELYKLWDKPADERIAELETGLKEAVEMLSANSRAGKSKIMQNIWSDIIVALQGNQSNE
jgi:hypothetical protein